ncbi:MAG TPA: flagellar basal-body rod protein FlgF [Gammaproteobacteria bacterium]|nr:flagellar basal-body rod protein FlgF [Gammaproteobacteria bacterium]HRF44381.1 flagellar basal-body rod protein FlgF [Candidatus Competibacteraceae bacterium]
MDRMLYVAMTGAQQTLQTQALISHNLANVSTVGFRKDLEDFRSMPVFSTDGMPTRVYSMTERPGIDITQAKIMTTGRDMDIAIQGEGWIAIQAPDGEEAYTRAGDLQLDVNGQLTTATGQPVLGTAGPIAIPPAQKIDIGEDGTISIRPRGEASTEIVVVDRIRLVKPTAQNPLYKDEYGFMRTKDGAAAPPDATVKLVTGALEGSNVNPADMLVSMIQASRHFEMQVKMMNAGQENANSSDQLLKLE